MRAEKGSTPEPRTDIADFLHREYSRYHRSVAHIASVYAPHLYTVQGFAAAAPPLRELLVP